MVKMPPSFAVEASLGRLALHLRLLGFDATYQQGGESLAFFRRMAADRIALTRTRRIRDQLPQRRCLFIRANDPREQVIAVLSELRLNCGDARPFSRCTRCNRPVETLARHAARGRVPDYVWQTQERFSTCPQCERVFWQGSHTKRHQKMLNHWFNRSAIKQL